MKLLTLVLLGGLVAGAYYLAVWGPLFLDHVELKRRCDEAVNSTWRQRDPGRTREVFLRKVHAIGRNGAAPRDAFGGPRPAIDPADEDLQVWIDESVDPAILTIDVVYARTAELPWLDRERTFWFSHRCEQDLSEVIWE